MTSKKIFYIFLIAYALVTLVFFVHNVLMASEETPYEKIIKKEKIDNSDQRETLRAFYTAPPVIPHEVESQDSHDCLRCHLDVTILEDGRTAMKTPHPQFSSCLQCHVPSMGDKDFKTQTSWQGLKEPKRGDRWFWISPPTIPHRIYMRENCLSCHGPENPDMRLRTTHPERTSCLQCHVPNYEEEF